MGSVKEKFEEMVIAMRDGMASLQQATVDLDRFLASLNLSVVSDDYSEIDLPQSMRDKAAHVRQNGGIRLADNLTKELCAAPESHQISRWNRSLHLEREARIIGRREVR